MAQVVILFSGPTRPKNQKGSPCPCMLCFFFVSPPKKTAPKKPPLTLYPPPPQKKNLDTACNVLAFVSGLLVACYPSLAVYPGKRKDEKKELLIQISRYYK